MHQQSMIFFTLFIYFLHFSFAQSLQNPFPFTEKTTLQFIKKPKVLFGIASFYADKFNGRKTATGDIYSHNKMTAACNLLPLGSWIRVTNLRNKRSVIVRVNDRLHPKKQKGCGYE